MVSNWFSLPLKFFLAKRELFYVLLFVLAGFFISLNTLLQPMLYADMDSYDRANWGYNNYAAQQLLNLHQVGGAWLPLHANILGASILLFKDPQLSPRLITLLLNIFSIPLMYFYVKSLFSKLAQKEMAGLLASIIWLFHPLRIMLATVPLSESISVTIFLVLLVLLSAKNIKISWVIFFLNIGCAIRFEFWFMVPLIWLIFLTHERVTWRSLLSCGLCALFPIYWIVLNYSHSGNPLGFFAAKYVNAYGVVPQVPYYNFYLASKGWFNTLGDLIGISGFCLLICGFIRALKENYFNLKSSIFLIIPIYLFFSLIVQVFLGTMEWLAPRYLFAVLIGVIPIISYGLLSTIEFFGERKRSLASVLICIILLIFLTLDVFGLFANIKNWMQTGDRIEESYVLKLVDYYRTHNLAVKKLVYVNESDWFWPMFIFLTQRHDIDTITPQKYFSSNTQEYETVILHKSKSATYCKGSTYFESPQFLVCDF